MQCWFFERAPPRHQSQSGNQNGHRQEAGALRPKTDGSKTDAKSQGKNGRKKNGCKQATSGRSHAQTDASETDEKRQGKNGRKQANSGPNGRKPQPGALRPKPTQNGKAKTGAGSKRAGAPRRKRTQPARGCTQAQTDAKKQGKTIRKQATRGSTQSQADACSKRVHSSPTGRKTTRQKHMQAASGFKTDASNN